MDPNFTGYKLSLDNLGVSKDSLSNGPVHTLPSADMFSFLHVKLFGEHNHVILDSFNENMVYFISGSGTVYSVTSNQSPAEVWTLPVSGLERSYNPAIVFPSADLAVLSDGTGTLFILQTGNRKGENMWKSVFEDAVCGKNRPFEVRYAVLSGGGELEIVLQYVEDRDKMDCADQLPSQLSGESTFFNVLEWMSFAKMDKGWMMERVRRVISHGGFNYVSITGDNLAVSAEKKTVLCFDSLHPAETLNLERETEAMQEEAAQFYWRQTPEDLEMWFYILPDLKKAQVNVEVAEKGVEVRLAGATLIKGNLVGKVEVDSWTWTLENGKLGIMMSKQAPGPWPSMWGAEGGPKGIQILEDSEDLVLPHLTTDNPINSGCEASGDPAFNAQELESVDDCMDENSTLVWQSGAGVQHHASLAGQQHLLVVQQVDNNPPALCIRHDVDGFVWKVEDCNLVNVANFPALGYVQAGKQSRKFMVAPHNFSYSAICDAQRHIYVYRQPQPLAEGSELRNRKSGVKVSGVAMQQVVTLENNEEILGLQATPNMIFLVTQHSLYRININ